MISRREAAKRLDIPIEMAVRHDLPAWMSESVLADLDENPPAWLLQSRANRRSSKRPVWVQLTCDVCGLTADARPKKWWPEFTYLSCSDHDIWDLPEPADGLTREEFDGIGGQFIGVVDR
ncbi:MAG: hypothetical protein JWM49_407 [Microbacteriaceae bacterium]|nr:hypothetical protein [Microbacteriaceae bacterium]